MTSLRIAYLLEFPTLLGGERSWLAMVREITGITPFAVAPSTGPLAEALREAGIAHIPWDWPAVGPERRAELLANLLASVQPQLVHANSLTTSLCAADLGTRLSCPAVGHCRDIMGLSQARVDRLNRLDALIAVSKATAQHLRKQGVRAEIIEVIHNGIDAAKEWNPANVRTDRSEMLAAAGLPADARLLVWVGQLVQRKDPLTFLRALPSLMTAHPDLHAVLLGARHSRKDEAEAYEQDLHDLALQDPLRGRVHFLGDRTDVRDWLALADVGVNTSRQDPLCRVLLESLALARPVVATRVGGTAEIITHEEHGLLAPPANPSALGAAIASLITDPSHAVMLGRQGRDRIRTAFTVAATARRVRNVYDRVLSSAT